MVVALAIVPTPPFTNSNNLFQVICASIDHPSGILHFEPVGTNKERESVGIKYYNEPSQAGFDLALGLQRVLYSGAEHWEIPLDV